MGSSSHYDGDPIFFAKKTHFLRSRKWAYKFKSLWRRFDYGVLIASLD